MTDKTGWPQWLKAADTKDARVEISPYERVIWHGGEWHDGVWHDGVWHDGVWRGGVWRGGEWHDGVWRGGVWRGGVWRGGVWCGGVWHDGEWRGGVWRGGVWCGGVWCGGVWHDGEWRGGVWREGWSTCNRAPYTVLSDGKGNIRFGCQTRTRDEWIAIAEGRADPPDEAPKRGTQEWRLLVASLRAQIAYDDALAEQEPG